VSEHGYGGLYAGLVPRVAKIAPACAIMIGSYEVCKEYFHEYNNNMTQSDITR
jgi:solute carrier family 25 protein 39/40